MMSKNTSIQEEELSLVSLIFIIYEKKIIITIITFISLLIGITFIQIKDNVYESKIYFSVNLIPPSFGNVYDTESMIVLRRKIEQDFENLFFLKKSFDKWKLNNNTQIDYDEFSRLIIKDKILFAKKEKDLNLIFKTEKNNAERFIKINSNKAVKLNAYYDYATFINNLLGKLYLTRANQDYNFVFDNLKKLNDDEGDNKLELILSNLNINRFKIQLTGGEQILLIKRPTIPQKIYPKNKVIIFISCIIGLIFSLFYIFLQNAIRGYRNNYKLN